MAEITKDAQDGNSLSTDLTVITSEINAYKRIAGEAIFEIGRRLKHVKEHDLAHGEFGEWLESVEMSRDYAGRFIRIYDELGYGNYVSGRNLGIKALYEIAQLPESERDRTHTTADGTSKKPEDMTVKELREVKRQLKAAESERDIAKRDAEDLREFAKKQTEKEPEVRYETKHEVKTEYVDNTDYEAVERLRKYAYLHGAFRTKSPKIWGVYLRKRLNVAVKCVHNTVTSFSKTTRCERVFSSPIYIGA